MQTGVRDGGFNINNSKDIIKSVISTKVGYTINKELSANFAYSISTSDEFLNSNETLSSAITISINYKI
jgi:hypothetical protein